MTCPMTFKGGYQAIVENNKVNGKEIKPFIFWSGALISQNYYNIEIKF